MLYDMKLHIVSDLHLDVAYLPPLKRCGDLLVIAGDLTTGPVSANQYTAHLDRIAAEYGGAHSDSVFLIPGNHEFYGKSVVDVVASGQQHQTRVVDGVRIVGNTMWTDFRLYEKSTGMTSEIAQLYAKGGMSDYRFIQDMRPYHTMEAYATFIEFLVAQTVEAEKNREKLVVVTHHGSHIHSLDERYEGSSINSAYVSHTLETIYGRAWSMLTQDAPYKVPDLWVHGHVHASKDYVVGDTRVVVNPRGYYDENPDFNPELVVEV